MVEITLEQAQSLIKEWEHNSPYFKITRERFSDPKWGVSGFIYRCKSTYLKNMNKAAGMGEDKPVVFASIMHRIEHNAKWDEEKKTRVNVETYNLAIGM